MGVLNVDLHRQSKTIRDGVWPPKLLHVTPAEVLLSQARNAENTSPD